MESSSSSQLLQQDESVLPQSQQQQQQQQHKSAFGSAKQSNASSISVAGSQSTQSRKSKMDFQDIAMRENFDLSNPQDLEIIQTILGKEINSRTKYDIEILYKVFSQVKFFADMEKEGSTKQIKNLIKNIEYEAYTDRNAVFHQGQQGSKFYVILSGSAWVLVPNKFSSGINNAQILQAQALQKDPKASANLSDSEFLEKVYPIFKPIATLKQGQSFGEIALRQRTVRTATIVCKEPTFLATITRSVFNICVSQYYEAVRDTEINFLQQFHLFADLYKQDIEMILMSCVKQSYLKKQVIYSEGQPADTIYFLQSGEIQITKAIDIFAEDANDLYLNRQKDLKATGLPKRKPKNQLRIGSEPSPLATVKKIKKRVSVAYVVENNIFGDEETFCGKVRETKAVVLSQSCTFYCLKMSDFMQIMAKRFTSDHIARLKTGMLHEKIMYRQENYSKMIEVNQIYSDFQQRIDEENLVLEKKQKNLLFEGKYQPAVSSASTTSASTPRSSRKQKVLKIINKEPAPKQAQSNDAKRCASGSQMDMFCFTSPPELATLIDDPAVQLSQASPTLTIDPTNIQKKSPELFVCPPSMDLEKLNMFYHSPTRKRKLKTTQTVSTDESKPQFSRLKPSQQTSSTTAVAAAAAVTISSEKQKLETDLIKNSTTLSSSQKNLILLSMNKEKKQQMQFEFHGYSYGDQTIMHPQSSPKKRKPSDSNNPIGMWKSLYLSDSKVNERQTSSHKSLGNVFANEVAGQGKSASSTKKRPVSASHCVRATPIASARGKKDSKNESSMTDLCLKSASPPLSECDEVEMKLIKNLVVNSIMNKDKQQNPGLERHNWAQQLGQTQSQQKRPATANRPKKKHSFDQAEERQIKSARNQSMTTIRKASEMDELVHLIHSELKSTNQQPNAKDKRVKGQLQISNAHNSSAANTALIYQPPQFKQTPQHLQQQYQQKRQVQSQQQSQQQQTLNHQQHQSSQQQYKEQQQQSSSPQREASAWRRKSALNPGRFFLNGSKQMKYYLNIRQENITDKTTSPERQTALKCHQRIRHQSLSQQQKTTIDSDPDIDVAHSRNVSLTYGDEYLTAPVAGDKRNGSSLDIFKLYIRNHLYNS